MWLNVTDNDVDALPVKQVCFEKHLISLADSRSSPEIQSKAGLSGRHLLCEERLGSRPRSGYSINCCIRNGHPLCTLSNASRSASEHRERGCCSFDRTILDAYLTAMELGKPLC